MEAEETNSWGIRGKGRNLGCKMQTTRVSYIYVDTGFERKWENCFNEALRYYWDRFHRHLILPGEIFTVCETTVSKLVKLPYPPKLVMIPPDCLVGLCSPGIYNRNSLG